MRTLLFESVRELLFNIVKHAKVDRAAVDLSLNDDLICITVTDRGAGFDPELAFSPLNVHHVGLGLFSIRERVALLGGRLDIDSGPGRGTRFTLLAPRRSSDPQSAGIVPAAIRILIADDHAIVCVKAYGNYSPTTRNSKS